MKKTIVLVLLSISILSNSNGQQQKVTKHENVVYGMISGMALLMDVYQPEHANNIGVIFIAGSGFGFPDDYKKVYNQVPLKDDFILDKGYVAKYAPELINKGYTIFFINHRFSPRFHYPDPIEDCRRAVRFIRYNASKYNINPGKIGAIGNSSGAYLAAMIGVLDEVYYNVDKSPVDSVSSKVQAVVALAGTFVLSDFNTNADSSMDAKLLGVRIVFDYMNDLPAVENGKYILSGRFAQASPITNISKGDAPFLIYVSDNDPLIPPRQSTAMYKKLVSSGIEAKLIVDPGSGHFPKPDINEIDNWFKKYLK